MDFSLTEEQREWQHKARRFADEELKPLTLERDRIADPRQTFDWEIIKKGSRLGFRTLAVPKAYGGHGADLVTQTIVMAELARGDNAISKTFCQCWKWSQLITIICNQDQQDRFIRPFMADDTTPHPGASRICPMTEETSFTYALFVRFANASSGQSKGP